MTAVVHWVSATGLRCSFDYGLYPPATCTRHQEDAFTCLAEAVLLATDGHEGDFTVGRPTEGGLERIAALARRYVVGPREFEPLTF